MADAKVSVGDGSVPLNPMSQEDNMRDLEAAPRPASAAGFDGGAYRSMGADHLDVVNPSLLKPTTWHLYLNKGSVSNMLTFCVMVLGIVLVSANDSTFGKYVLSLGLFGFAGGVTNWLAVTMLFDQIPGLIGSGVIPRRFREIRRSVKETIMITFFDRDYLRNYLGDRTKSLIESLEVERRVTEMLDKPEIEALLVEKLTAAAATPEGAVLNMVQGFVPNGMAGLVPMIKPMLAGFATELGPLLTKSIDVGSDENIEKIRAEIDRLMTEKLQLLTPGLVKQLMERVIREHLGWLIVWGNVFGALIGLVSQAAGFGA